MQLYAIAMQLLPGIWFMILSSLVPSHFSCKTVSMKNPMCSCVTILVVSCATVASRWLKMTQKVAARIRLCSSALKLLHPCYGHANQIHSSLDNSYASSLPLPYSTDWGNATWLVDVWLHVSLPPVFKTPDIFKGLPSWRVLNLRGS